MKSVAVLAIAVVLAGCSSGGSDPTSVAPVPPKSEFNLNDQVAFTRASDGKRIGTFTVAEAVVVPDECVVDPPFSGRQALAIRTEIVNDGDMMLPAPDSYSVKMRDAGGSTQDVEIATFRLDCTALYPHIAESQFPGKTSGWAIFEVAQANPVALMYVPYVANEGSTAKDIQFAVLSPAFAVVKLPASLPTGVRPPAANADPTTIASAPTSTTLPAPRSTPAAGQACTPGSDNWALDTSGGQLKCAYAGGPTPKWVQSAPLVGTRTPGTSCELGAGVAESAAGQTLVCVGDRGSPTWEPGP